MFALVASSASAAPSRVLVIPSSGGVGPTHLTPVRTGIAALPETSVVSAAETEETLVSVAVLGVECTRTDPACAARIGALGGVDRVVVVSHADGVHSLLLVDVISTEQRSVARKTAGLAGEDLSSAFSTAVVELFTPERYTGALELSGGPAGASVVVDGAEVGVLPLAAPLSLAPGARAVKVLHQGNTIFEQTLDIGYGTSTALSVEAPPPVATHAAPVDEPLAVLPLSLLIGGGVLSAASVISAFTIVGVFLYLGYSVCASYSEEGRGNAGLSEACFESLGIYGMEPVESSFDLETVQASQWVFVVGLVGVLVTGLAGGGLVGASFFVE